MFSEAFDNQNGDGMRPMAGLFLDGNSLYGTTFYGGEAANGVLFSVGLNNTNFSLLHTFNPGSDASNPEGVLCGNANTIYGTAPDTLFSLALADTNYYVLHTFEGGADDGAGPEGGLLLVSNTLYGASVGGGTPGDGTIYSLVPPWTHHRGAANECVRCLRRLNRLHRRGRSRHIHESLLPMVTIAEPP